MGSEFAIEWTKKWAMGVILGYGRDRIELNRAAGMLKRAISMIGKDEINAIIETVENGPIYLPALKEKKKEKFKPLRKELGL